MEETTKSLISGNISCAIGEIRGITNLDDAISKMRQIDVLKDALKSMKVFREQSLNYAILEAEALICVVELGGATSLSASHKATGEWLVSLSEDQRSAYIEMCKEGLTIDQVYKREIGAKLKVAESISVAEGLRRSLLEDYDKTGIVDMKPYKEQIEDMFCRGLGFAGKQTAADIIDGTRQRLRSRGAVGIGDGDGTYVNPNSGRKDEIRQAILLRYESIKNDCENIVDIAKAANLNLSYKDFEKDIYKASNRGEAYLIHLLLGFARIGIICDAEDLQEKIVETDFYAECIDVRKLVGWTREEYIKREYKKIMEKTTDAGTTAL